MRPVTKAQPAGAQTLNHTITPPPPSAHPWALCRDVWMSLLFVLAMISTLILGLVHWSRGNTETPLIISLVYMVYNIIPQYLLLQVRWGVGGQVGQ